MDITRGLPIAVLDKLIGARDYRLFLNSKNETYRERDMKNHPPGRDEALRLMAKNPNLVRRPILVKGRQIVLGYDPEAMGKLAAARPAAETT